MCRPPVRWTPRPVETTLRFAACCVDPSRTQLHQGRQKSRQRLAGAGRRDQQRRAVLARLGQQCELMRARRPAARREPFLETVRKQRGRLRRRLWQRTRRHRGKAKCSERLRRGLADRQRTSPRSLAGRGRVAQSDPGEGHHPPRPPSSWWARTPLPDPLPVKTWREAPTTRSTPSRACPRCPSPGR